MAPRHPLLQVRLTLGALALLLVAVASLGTWQVFSARSSEQRQIEGSQAAKAHLASSALASALAGEMELVKNLADLPSLATVFEPKYKSKVSNLAAELHQLYPDFASLEVIAGDGRLLSVWPSDPALMGQDVASSGSFTAVMRSRRAYLSGALDRDVPGHALVVGLAAPVLNRAGTIVGVMQGDLSAPTISSIIGGTRLPDGTKLVIVDQSGHVLSGPAASSVRAFRSTPLVVRALAGSAGSGTGLVPGYSGNRLVGYAPVPSTGWAVLAEASPATTNSLLSGLTDRLAAIGLIVLVMASGTALLVGLLLRRLGREHEHTRAVLNDAAVGVATIDPSGRPLLVNPALEDLSGRTAGELLGHDWSEAIPLYDQQGHLIVWEASIAAQAIGEGRVVASSGYDIHLARPDGRRVPVTITATPFIVADKLTGAVVILRDVSREREVDQLKSSLVSTVSHELRTPLTMIQGFSELLLSRDDLGPDRSRDALQQIHRSSQRLGRLIDDLLSVSRIESGKLSVDFGPVDLGAVITDVVATFEAQTGRHFVTEVDPRLTPVLADLDKVVQVVTNLVSNAVKYSPVPGAIEVVASHAGDHAEISVTDHGIGMSEDERAHLFEKFTRADRPEVRKAGGTGLGLYITKSLVEMQHGQLWVRSALGAGSTFSVSLPLAQGPDGAGGGEHDQKRRALEEAIDR